MRFLVADDHPVNRKIVGKMLAAAGAASDFAENGRQAVELFEGSEPGTYDAVLMDVRMPVMDGYAATRAIRAG
ncbi:MAG: response regulator, partial [Gordonibacter urolithinfaciens]